MLMKTLLITLILSISTIYGQNSNAAANAAKAAAEAAMQAANTAMEVANRAVDVKDIKSKPAKPIPTLPPIPSNTTIRGKVYFEDDGKPLRRTRFMLTGKEPPRSELFAVTDDLGNFEIKNVQKGTYLPIVISPNVVSPINFNDYEPESVRKTSSQLIENLTKDFPKIEVDGIKDLETKIPVKRGGVVSGKVTYSDGSPAIGVNISVNKKGSLFFSGFNSIYSRVILGYLNGGVSFQTDDLGNYRITGLPAGEFIVSVNEDANHIISNGKDDGLESFLGNFLISNSYLNSFYQDTVEQSKATPIKVELGKETKNIDIKINHWKLYKISGKVISAKDKKPMKAKVYLVSEAESQYWLNYPGTEMFLKSLTMNDNGEWAFKDLPNGKYKLKIVPQGSESMYDYTLPSAANVSVSGKSVKTKPIKYAIQIKDFKIENANIENLQIEIGIGATISGTVTFERENDFIDHFNISFVNENGDIIGTGYIRRFSDDKVESKTKFLTKPFVIENLPSGKLKLKIDSRDETVSVKSATANGVDLLNNFIELKEGQVLPNVRIVLEKKK